MFWSGMKENLPIRVSSIVPFPTPVLICFFRVLAVIKDQKW